MGLPSSIPKKKMTWPAIFPLCPYRFQDQERHRVEVCPDQVRCGQGTFINASSVSAGVCEDCPEGHYQGNTSHRDDVCTAQAKCKLSLTIVRGEGFKEPTFLSITSIFI